MTMFPWLTIINFEYYTTSFFSDDPTLVLSILPTSSLSMLVRRILLRSMTQRDESLEA